MNQQVFVPCEAVSSSSPLMPRSESWCGSPSMPLSVSLSARLFCIFQPSPRAIASTVSPPPFCSSFATTGIASRTALIRGPNKRETTPHVDAASSQALNCVSSDESSVTLTQSPMSGTRILRVSAESLAYLNEYLHESRNKRGDSYISKTSIFALAEGPDDADG